MSGGFPTLAYNAYLTVLDLTLFPMGSGHLFPMGGRDNIAPLSKIQEKGRLGLNLWMYINSGQKLQKNPNQFHMNQFHSRTSNE